MRLETPLVEARRLFLSNRLEGDFLPHEKEFSYMIYTPFPNPDFSYIHLQCEVVCRSRNSGARFLWRKEDGTPCENANNRAVCSRGTCQVGLRQAICNTLSHYHIAHMRIKLWKARDRFDLIFLFRCSMVLYKLKLDNKLDEA